MGAYWLRLNKCNPWYAERTASAPKLDKSATCQPKNALSLGVATSQVGAEPTQTSNMPRQSGCRSRALQPYNSQD